MTHIREMAEMEQRIDDVLPKRRIMTDKEMLELSLQAFEAVTTAEASKRLLTRMAVPHVAYTGTASYRLAKTMQKKLRQHLGIKED